MVPGGGIKVTRWVGKRSMGWPAGLFRITCVALLVATVSGAALAQPRPVETGTKKDLHAVAYGGGRFVAVGDGGTVLASGDGVRWLPVAAAAEEVRLLASQGSADPPDLAAVIHAGGRFVAVGEGGIVLVSPDGKTWRGSRALPDYPGSLRTVAYGAGIFVAGGTVATLLTSPDGLSWQRQELPVSAGFTVTGLAYGKGLFVAVGFEGKRGLALTSPDGARWTAQPEAMAELAGQGKSSLLRSVVFGGGRFVAVAEDAVVYSDDGAAWKLAALSPTCPLRWVAHVGEFAAVGSCGDVYVSQEGVGWRMLGQVPAQLEGVAVGGCVVPAVGAGGRALAMSLGLAEGGGISDVEVDGVCLGFPDARPVIVGGRTLVPVRALAERGFGYRVGWNAAKGEVTLTGMTPGGARRTVVLAVGARTARVDGRAAALEVPAAIRQSRVYVPLRFVAEAFAADVRWDPVLRVVRICRTACNDL